MRVLIRLLIAFEHTDAPEKAPSPSLSTPLLPAKQYASAVIVRSAQRVNPTPEETTQRQIFLQNLSILPGVTLVNNLDNSSPPTTFRFIKESVLGQGVERAPDEYMAGCTCAKKHGRNLGCAYLDCCCIEDSALDKYGKRQFPYSGPSNRDGGNPKQGCLRNFYIESRNHLYECNKRCDCAQDCKNRVVQHGRKVRVEIFKTSNRGWGKATIPRSHFIHI